MSFQKRNIRESAKKKERRNSVQKHFQKIKGGANTFFESLQKKSAAPSQYEGERKGTSLEQKRKQRRRMRWAIGLIGIILGGIVVFETAARVTTFFRNFEFTDLLWFFGTDLPTDEYGMTNILLLGVGGDKHSGGTLTDSMLIASIDYQTESVSLLSIPRDFYIDTARTSSRVNSIITDIMATYPRSEQDKGYNDGMQLLQDTIEDIFEIQVHNYAQIDFRGFEEGIDALGGVDVNVEKTVDDYSYPTANWGYEHFFLPAGQQHLDGETALKYVRSRHGSSDFDRSRRQQNLLKGIQEKATSSEILTSPKKLRELLGIVQDNLKTDLEWQEMVALANVGYNFPRENIFSFGLNNDENSPGGFLVTPDRDLYGGAFVLVPFLNLEKDKYARIRMFAENVFRHREFSLGTTRITILNGTRLTGLAGTSATHLERFGIPVFDVDNSAEKIEDTIIQFPDTEQGRATAEFLQRYMTAELEPKPVGESEDSDVDVPTAITIIIGTNHQNYRIPEAASPSFLPTS